MTNVLQGQPLNLIKYALEILTGASRRASAHLGEHTARGTWFLPEARYKVVTVTRVYTTEGNRCNHKIMGELCVWSSFGHT